MIHVAWAGYNTGIRVTENKSNRPMATKENVTIWAFKWRPVTIPARYHKQESTFYHDVVEVVPTRIVIF